MNKIKNKLILIVIELLVIFISIYIFKVTFGSSYTSGVKIDYYATKTVKSNPKTDTAVSNNTTTISQDKNNSTSISNDSYEQRLAKFRKDIQEDSKQIYRNVFKQYIVILLFIGALYALWIAGIQKISIDLEISPIYRLSTLFALIITTIVSIVSLYNGNISNFNLYRSIGQIAILLSVLGIFYKVGVNPFALILAFISAFIPVIGGTIYLIIFSYGMWLLGTYYNKSTGFKIGLILLNIIGLPAMAFNWKFIK